MNTKKYQLIFYFITATIVATIAVQFFWNYKNYEENKVRVANEIQLSLDNAIEEYYAKLAKTEYTAIVNLNDSTKNGFKRNFPKIDTLFKHSNILKNLNKKNTNDTSKRKSKFEVTSIFIETNKKSYKNEKDSVLKLLKEINKPINETSANQIKEVKIEKNKNFQIFTGKEKSDSLKLIESLQPIFISFSTNEIDYKQLDSLLKNQLTLKKIPIDFTFNHYKKDTIFYTTKDSILNTTFEKSVYSKSTFLKDNEDFELQYNNIDFEALKRSSSGIFLSLVLSLTGLLACPIALAQTANASASPTPPQRATGLWKVTGSLIEGASHICISQEKDNLIKHETWRNFDSECVINSENKQAKKYTLTATCQEDVQFTTVFEGDF